MHSDLSHKGPEESPASILLVDDNPANLLSLRAILEPLGQNLVDAHSGLDALQAMASAEFAVVLLDVLMPGINGFETAKRMRSEDRLRHTPIIFLTAADIDREQLEEGYALGAVDFLVKPLAPFILQAKVRGFVELFQDKRRTRQEAEQLRLLVHGTTDYAIFMLDPNGYVVTWNSGAERLKGYKAEEITGQHFSRFYPQEAIDRGWPAHELKVAESEGRFEDEGWRVRKDGSQFWANVVITALREEVGKLRGFSKITRDLTERKYAEEAARRLVEETTARRVAEENARLIQEQRERLRITLSSIGDAVISTDAEGRVDFLNPIAEVLIGWKTEEAAGRSLTDVFHIVNEDTREPVDNPAMRALREGEIVGLANHTVLISKTGVECPIDDSAAPIRDTERNVIGSVLVFRDITERKRSHAAVAESETRFRSLMEQSPFSIQIFSPDGHTRRVNKAWERLWELRFDQVEDYNILEDRQLVSKGVMPLLQRAFAGEAVSIPAVQYDLKLTSDPVGERRRSRWVSAIAYPLKSQDGRIEEVVVVHEDITARKNTDIALRESEERLRLALEAGRMGVWDWNIRTNEMNWSDSLEPLHGLARGSFAGTLEAFRKLIHPADRETVDRTIQRAIEQRSGYEIEFRSLWSDGSIHWIAGKGMVLVGNDGQPERMIGIGMDVTQRRRSEQSARFLADASATLSVLVDFDSTLQKVASLAVPYFADWVTVDLVEADGSLRRVAVAHVDPSKVALAREMHHRFPPDPAAPHGVWHILRTGTSEWVAEITDDLLTTSVTEPELLRILGELGLKSYIGVPLKARGKTLGVLTFISAESGHLYDATDLAVAQELADRGAIAIENTRLYRELREADRRKDEFLATLAHELRNPLAPIRNSLQILKMPRVDPAIAQQTKDMMERQVHHLVRLVDDLLDVSRVMRGKIELRMELVELETIIARAVETTNPLIEIQRHQFDISVPQESLLLNVDPVRLTQVVGNLLTNAAKYTKPGGRIWLTIGREGDQAVLKIRDTGIGIAPDMLPHVFDLFVQADHTFTKAQGGLGIGLTLVKNLVEMHEGTVQVHSPGLGKGCEFVVRLSLASQQASETTADVLGESTQFGATAGHRLLVVDDNQDAAISLSMLLRLRGHEVRVAHDGLSALQLVTDFNPDMVLLDIGMPGMDGYEVARRVRSMSDRAQTVLTALTGWGQEEDRRRTAEAGFDHHLVKPPELSALEIILNSLAKPAKTGGVQ